MRIKFLILCFSCMFLFFLNINCSSSESITQEEIASEINANMEVIIENTPNVVKVPSMLILGSIFDFPDVEEGTNVVHVWEVKNVGTDDLIISDIESSCGCASAITDSKTIAPNSSTKLKTVFDTKGMIGTNRKFIIVHSNDPANPAMQLSIRGNVVPKGVSKN